MNPQLTYFCDRMRHLVCQPYSIPNLHRMAADLKIKKCWFHGDHYDIPASRVKEVEERCTIVHTRDVLLTIGRATAFKGRIEKDVLEVRAKSDKKAVHEVGCEILE